MKILAMLLSVLAVSPAFAEQPGSTTSDLVPEVWVDMPEDPTVGDDVEWHFIV